MSDKTDEEKTETMEKSRLVRKDPLPGQDTGYAWVIMGLCFYLHLLGFSTNGAFGVFYIEVAKKFGVSHMTTSLMTLVMTMCMGFSGPVLGPTIKKVGARPVAMIASAVHGGALILAGFIPNVPFLFFTLALLPGLSMGGQKICAISCVQQYFCNYSALALGLSTSAIGIATLIYGPFVAWLMHTLHWRYSLLVLGCIQMTGVITCFFLFPFKKPETDSDSEKYAPIVPEKTEEEKKKKRRRRASKSKQDPEKMAIINNNDDVGSDVDDDDEGEGPEPGCACCLTSACCKGTGFYYFSHCEYLVFWLGLVFNQIGHGTPIIYLPLRGIELGQTEQKAAFLVSIAGITTTVARFLFGFTLDLECIRDKRVYIIGVAAILNGISTVVSSLVNWSEYLFFYAAVYGTLSAYYTLMQFITLTDFYGKEDACIFSGHVQCAIGVSRITLNLISGFLLDYAQDSSLPFLCNGTIQIIGGIMLFLCVLVKMGAFDKKK